MYTPIDVEAGMEKSRAKALLFERQNGLCFYCDRPSWMPSEGAKKAAERLGMPTEGHRWHKNIRKRLATIEHRHRRAVGGPDKIENYVIACQGCNASRGGRKAEDHREAMLAAHTQS